MTGMRISLYESLVRKPALGIMEKRTMPTRTTMKTKEVPHHWWVLGNRLALSTSSASPASKGVDGLVLGSVVL